ncbi:MAG TPA: SPOR domain-containing protein [Lysobacter sp.]
MAARRGKSQARRNQGNDGLPGWAWMIIGIVLAIGVIFMAPKFLKSDGDGFFRPQPNPDAQPATVAEDDDSVVPDTGAAPAKADNRGTDKKGPEYDFYTLLPGKEVPLSDAELAATEKAEAQRLAAQQKQQAQAATQSEVTAAPAATDSNPLPAPIDAGSDAEAATPTATPTAPVAATTTATTIAAVPAGDNTRYLLQAGAFQASGQAEELKARIALLGLGARVESAAINGKTVYRVRMGPYGTASDLADAKRKLASGGLPAMAIKVK